MLNGAQKMNIIFIKFQERKKKFKLKKIEICYRQSQIIMSLFVGKYE